MKFWEMLKASVMLNLRFSCSLMRCSKSCSLLFCIMISIFHTIGIKAVIKKLFLLTRKRAVVVTELVWKLVYYLTNFSKSLESLSIVVCWCPFSELILKFPVLRINLYNYTNDIGFSQKHFNCLQAWAMKICQQSLSFPEITFRKEDLALKLYLIKLKLNSH